MSKQKYYRDMIKFADWATDAITKNMTDEQLAKKREEFIAERIVKPTKDVEEKYNLPPGSLDKS